jgi:SAM-dependent methyltransferase
MKDALNLTQIYNERFGERDRLEKNRIWQILCRKFFQKYVRPTDTVLDLAAGFCEFINNIECGTRIAVDLNPEIKSYARSDVQVVIAPSTDLSAVPADSVDVVFVSNFFEHLPNKDIFMLTLQQIRSVLRSGGKLLILQPNIAAVGGRYWDFVDHHLPLTERTLVEALNLVDMEVSEVRARFLPYTTKGNTPRASWMIALYLMFPPAQWIMGRQAWVVGVKP